jgi:ElaB/YqjD/DUF883 family membrane-anchored ribosome-binding protein
MGQTTDEIENEIDRARGDLKSNLEELESRAKDMADWRTYVERHPVAMIAAAAIGGALLAMIGGGSSVDD